MKSTPTVNTTLEVRRDISGLFWHVTVSRTSDGASAYTTMGKKPDLSNLTVQRLIQALSHK